ncbi:hypothetical protein [Kribbella shirazensis]|uniref:Uncharacterized protein n=1 Tax=Kribbella shirazensis TaxID=1105143 RepID=A0A7X5V4B1_9ACTN|nr:hypothetical protein [Kribbella shirazensis]NIK54330.1 hypothetical protein [Kribbella shirazensis]
MARHPAGPALVLTPATVALVVGGGLILQAATTNPWEGYVSYSDQLNVGCGTYEDVTRLSWLTPDENRTISRLHVACNEYDAARPCSSIHTALTQEAPGSSATCLANSSTPSTADTCSQR